VAGAALIGATKVMKVTEKVRNLEREIITPPSNTKSLGKTRHFAHQSAGEHDFTIVAPKDLNFPRCQAHCLPYCI
jgi:hypothetical protein